MEKNIFFPQSFYVFIMFITTKFGENFEEKSDICLMFFLLKPSLSQTKFIWTNILANVDFRLMLQQNPAKVRTTATGRHAA